MGLVNGWVSVIEAQQWRSDRGEYLQLGALYHPAQGYQVFWEAMTVPEGEEPLTERQRATERVLGRRCRAWAEGLGAVNA